MSKKAPEKKETKNKKNKIDITLARKGKKVIQSNGIPYFQKWAEKAYTGGKKVKGDRPAFKAAKARLFAELIQKYEAKNREMDKPKPKNA